MTIRLRAHHLLCVLTYAGKGYSPAFIENYDKIIVRLRAGETVRLVDGPDEICGPVVASEREPHCTGDSVTKRDERAGRAVASVLGRSVETGDEFSIPPVDVAVLRRAFATGRIRDACDGCQWFDLCSGISNADYRGTLL